MLPLILGLLATTPALAGKHAADACLKTKIWDRYGDGWQVRSSSATDLGFGKTKYYRVTLLKGARYQVVTCADDNVIDLDVLLYDKDGQLIHRDDTTNREPVLSYEAQETGVYYAVLYLRNLEDRAVESHVSMALIHH